MMNAAGNSGAGSVWTYMNGINATIPSKQISPNSATPTVQGRLFLLSRRLCSNIIESHLFRRSLPCQGSFSSSSMRHMHFKTKRPDSSLGGTAQIRPLVPACRQPALQRQEHRATFAIHEEQDRLIRLRLVHRLVELLNIGYSLMIHLLDHIAALNTGFRCFARFVHLVNYHS